MKLQDALRKAADLLDLATSTLDMIKTLTTSVKDDKAADVLKVVAAMVKTVQGGLDGAVAIGDVKKELIKLKDSLKANRDAATAALKRKFGKP